MQKEHGYYINTAPSDALVPMFPSIMINRPVESTGSEPAMFAFSPLDSCISLNARVLFLCLERASFWEAKGRVIFDWT